FAQAIRRQVRGHAVILDHGEGRDFLLRTLPRERRHLAMRRSAKRYCEGSAEDSGGQHAMVSKSQRSAESWHRSSPWRGFKVAFSGRCRASVSNCPKLKADKGCATLDQVFEP